MVQKLPAEFSDLFFNYPHATYDALYEQSSEGQPTDDAYDALVADATEFLRSYPQLCQFYCEDVDAESLAMDFMQRL